MKLKIFLAAFLTGIFTMSIGYMIGSPAIGVGLFAAGLLFIATNPVGDAAYLICGTITANQTADCNNPLTGGVDDVMYVYNFADIEDYDFNSGNTIIVEAINMVATKTGFTYTGQNYSNQPRWRLVKTPFGRSYEHEVEFLIFNYTGAVKKELEALLKGKIVIVVQHNFKGALGAAAFHLYGSEAGLFSESAEQDANSDIQGAIKIMLKSDPKGLEGHMPKPVFITSFAATKTMLDGTLV